MHNYFSNERPPQLLMFDVMAYESYYLFMFRFISVCSIITGS